MEDFDQLFEQSRQLTAHIVSGGGAMPQLDRGLAQIDALTRKLNAAKQATAAAVFAGSAGSGAFASSDASIFGQSTMTNPSAAPAAAAAAAGGVSSIDGRTAYLLANRGFDAEKVSATLNLINPATSFEPIEGLFDTDIEGYLNMEHQTIVASAVEENRAQTSKDCEERFERGLCREWEKTKKRIFDELGQHKQQQTQSFYQQKKTAIQSPSKSAMGATQDISSSVSSGGISMTGSQAPVGTVSLQMMARNKNYAQVIQKLQDSRVSKQNMDLIKEFANVMIRLDRGDAGHQQLIKCWSLIHLMLTLSISDTNVSNSSFGSKQSNPVKELEYAKVYRSMEDGAYFSDDAIQLRRRIVMGGRQFLEENYWTYVQQIVQTHRVAVGGMPSPDTIVEKYIDFRFKKGGNWTSNVSLEIMNGKAVWAQLYFLMRCGLKKEALSYVVQSLTRGLEGTADARFHTYFRAYVDGGYQLTSTLRNELLDEWNSRIRQGLVVDPATGRLRGDPFKAAIYKIIGRCEMSSKIIKSQDVAPSIEDYLWFQLMLIQEEASSAGQAGNLQDRYTLSDMARNMMRFGPAHFSPQGKTPHVYFLVLLLCGEFERAISHIISHESLTVDAIHFAIGLAYYGLLRVPESPHVRDAGFDLLNIKNTGNISNTGPAEIAYFHFARMIHQYSRQYFKTDPVDSLNYLALIGLYGKELGNDLSTNANVTPQIQQGREYTRVSHSFIKELILESGISIKLVGERRPEGTRHPGQIERLGPFIHLPSHADFVSRVLIPTAAEADRRSRFTDAIQLYDYAQEYDTVVGILCKQLGDSLATHKATTDLLIDPLYRSLGSMTSSSASAASKQETSEQLVNRATELIHFYRARPLITQKISPSRQQTVSTLVQLHHFVKECQEGRYDSALEQLLATKLFPHTPDMAIVSRVAEEFKGLDESVARCVPLVLLMGMSAVCEMWKGYKDGMGGLGGAMRQSRMNELRAQGRALILFAGSIQYRIPSDVYAKLNRLDVMMC